MINFNGQLSEKNNFYITPENRGLSFGDAVFETMRVSAGKIYFWEDHYFRLMAAMRIMRMEIPMDFTPEFLQNEILKMVEDHNKTKTFRVKLLVWRSDGGKYTPTSSNVSYVITLEKLDSSFYVIDEKPYEIELFKDFFLNSGLLSTLKTNNKAINVLGSIYAKENGYQNCLLLNEKKQVVDALNGNIFLVNGYKIKTPPLQDGALNGIIRKQLIAILATMPDYLLDETSVSPFELQKADEIFITNVITGIQPVTKYRKKEFKSDFAKQVIGKLNAKARLG